jgi:hypothetical protein
MTHMYPPPHMIIDTPDIESDLSSNLAKIEDISSNTQYQLYKMMFLVVLPE